MYGLIVNQCQMPVVRGGIKDITFRGCHICMIPHMYESFFESNDKTTKHPFGKEERSAACKRKRVQSSAFDSIELTPTQSQTKSGVLAKSSFQDPRHQSVVLQTACGLRWHALQLWCSREDIKRPWKKSTFLDEYFCEYHG